MDLSLPTMLHLSIMILPSNHSFTSMHSSKALRFNGMNYAKWRHGMKVHLMSLNPGI
jgi:hypothetical protein